MRSGGPDVSVVIPAYRGGPLLRRAVQSMAGQNFESLEVLVVSDGSDDPMDDLEALDARVRVIRCEHRGVSAARNTGLLESRGRFVAFLDEDDLAMEGRIAAQFAALSTDLTRPWPMARCRSSTNADVRSGRCAAGQPPTRTCSGPGSST